MSKHGILYILNILKRVKEIQSESALMKKSYKFIKERRFQERSPLENVLPTFRLNHVLVNEEIITLNISRSGLGFKSKYAINTNDIVELYLQIPNSISIPIVAKIIWNGFLDDTNIYGAEIIALQENYKGFLYKFTDK
jgi:hypothetical protein